MPACDVLQPVCRIHVALSAIGVTLSTACSMVIDERRFLLPGPAATPASSSLSTLTVEPVDLAAGDGVRLGGVRITQDGSDVDVLYFGGNASRSDDLVPFLCAVTRAMNVNLTMIDYRGYGRSAGQPTIAALKADALTAFDDLRARAGNRTVVVHGVSLGGFVAAHVAAHRSTHALVLEATAPDVNTWARAQVPFYAKPIIRLKIDSALLAESNVRALSRYSGPLFVMTGSEDAITPPRFAARLVDASPSTFKWAIVARGAQHGNALMVPEVLRTYREFLDLVLATTARPAH